MTIRRLVIELLQVKNIDSEIEISVDSPEYGIFYTDKGISVVLLSGNNVLITGSNGRIFKSSEAQ